MGAVTGARWGRADVARPTNRPPTRLPRISGSELADVSRSRQATPAADTSNPSRMAALSTVPRTVIPAAGSTAVPASARLCAWVMAWTNGDRSPRRACSSTSGDRIAGHLSSAGTVLLFGVLRHLRPRRGPHSWAAKRSNVREGTTTPWRERRSLTLTTVRSSSSSQARIWSWWPSSTLQTFLGHPDAEVAPSPPPRRPGRR